MAIRAKKPKCDGSTSQSCGMGCISRGDTCRELIAADVANRLLSVAKQHQQPNDAAGQSFDSIAANFPPSVLKAAHNTGVATKDLGNGAVLTTKEALGLDGSSIKYGFVTDADGKRYTVSDGLVKEVTSAVGSEWSEAFEAAVRSKVADSNQPAYDNTTATKSVLAEDFSGINKSQARRRLSSDSVALIETELKKNLSDADVAINITPLNLSKVLDSGRFKSQFETNTTEGGLLDFDRRAEAENTFLKYALDTRPEDRPIYGTASKGETGARQYGEIVVMLKPEVRARATVTIGDSAREQAIAGTPMLNPRLDSIPSSYSDSKKSEPDLVKALVERQKWFLDTDEDYVEAQIHGGVSTKDIDKVILPKAYKSSEPELLSKLTKQSILYEFV